MWGRWGFGPTIQRGKMQNIKRVTSPLSRIRQDGSGYNKNTNSSGYGTSRYVAK